MAWGAVAGAAISVIGGQMSADGADGAAGAQGQATGMSTAEQRRQYDLNRADLAPYRDAGGKAVNRLSVLLGLDKGVDKTKYSTAPIDYGSSAFKSISDPIRQKYALQYAGGNFAGVPPELRNQAYGEEEEAYRQSQMAPGDVQPAEGYGDLNKKFTLADFWDDPVTKASYEFGLNEGTKALGNMAGARGNRNSGAQLKALTKFGTDYTGQKAGDSYNRFYGDQDRTFNRLSGVGGTGQTAATNTAQLGSNSANQISGLMTSQGNARGAAAIAGGNASAAGFQNAGNTLTNWWNNNKNSNTYSGYDRVNDPWGGP